MRKKLILLITCVVLCFSSTGCVAIDTIQGQLKESSITSTIADDNKFAMTKETKEAQFAMSKASREYAASMAEDPNDKWPLSWNIPIVSRVANGVCGLVGQSAGQRVERAQKKKTKALNAAVANYELAKATDNVFLTATGNESEKKEQSFKKLLTPIIIIVALIIVLILILKRKPKVAPVTVAAPTLSPVESSPVESSPIKIHKAEAAVRVYCEKNGLDAEALYDKYGDWVSAAKGMFAEEV